MGVDIGLQAVLLFHSRQLADAMTSIVHQCMLYN